MVVVGKGAIHMHALTKKYYLWAVGFAVWPKDFHHCLLPLLFEVCDGWDA